MGGGGVLDMDGLMLHGGGGTSVGMRLLMPPREGAVLGRGVRAPNWRFFESNIDQMLHFFRALKSSICIDF